jgi:hypothetical protein
VRPAAVFGGGALSPNTFHVHCRLDTSGKRAKLRPRIVLETAEQVLAAPATVLTYPDRPGQDAEIIEVTPLGQLTQVTLQLSGGMGRC